MPNLPRLYKAQQATIVHATATPYRERSHFDGQDVLESGLAEAGIGRHRLAQPRAAGYGSSGGRVDPRAAGLGGRAGDAARGARASAGDVVGLPSRCCPPATTRRPAPRSLSSHGPRLASALEGRIGLVALGSCRRHGQRPSQTWPMPPPGIARVRAYLPRPPAPRRKLSRAAGRPARRRAGLRRLGHTHQRRCRGGQLAKLLGALDGAIAAIEKEMGDAWRETVVVVVTEFGRTARINGTEGTDHGTGTMALLPGGALKGGRVHRRLAGPEDADLYEGRDLKPTIDLRAVLKGVLSDHLRVEEQALASAVFPTAQHPPHPRAVRVGWSSVSDDPTPLR